MDLSYRICIYSLTSVTYSKEQREHPSKNILRTTEEKSHVQNDMRSNK